MKWLIFLLVLTVPAAAAQVPDTGDFQYELFDNSDRLVGSYKFSIRKVENIWRISSEMDVDTRVFLLRVRLRDHNSFTHDGNSFLSFEVDYFKDIPFQKNVTKKINGTREANHWLITSQSSAGTQQKTLSLDAFQEIRNLVSRLIRPEAVLKPGERISRQSLDPLTLEIGTVSSLGLREETVDFQGQLRRLFVIEQESSDGLVTVKKFQNGLIFRSQTAQGYALLKSADVPGF